MSQYLDCGGLSRAIGPKESHEGFVLDHDVQVIDRFKTREILSQVFNDYRFGHRNR
jgi:hypothetical protein